MSDSTNLLTGSYAFPVKHVVAFEVAASLTSLSCVKIGYEHEGRRWSHTIYPRNGSDREWDRLVSRCHRRAMATLDQYRSLDR